MSLGDHQKLGARRINQYARFDLPRFCGSGFACSADGTQFDLYNNNLLAEQHVRLVGMAELPTIHFR